MPVWGRSGDTTLGAARHASLRAIVLGDRIVGFWELDPDAGEVVWRPFAALPAAEGARIDALAEGTARFLLGELGHGRSFSLDHEKHMRTRVDAVRALRS